jgi:hypothetical protein
VLLEQQVTRDREDALAHLAEAGTIFAHFAARRPILLDLIRQTSCLLGQQVDGLGSMSRPSYGEHMPYDAERVKRSLERLMEEKGLEPARWAEESGLSKTTLINYLRNKRRKPDRAHGLGPDQGPRARTIVALGLEGRETRGRCRCLSTTAVRRSLPERRVQG